MLQRQSWRFLLENVGVLTVIYLCFNKKYEMYINTKNNAYIFSIFRYIYVYITFKPVKYSIPFFSFYLIEFN